LATYLVSVRSNWVAAHLLVLRHSRATFLNDDNQKAASLVRYMYQHTLDRVLSEKTLHLKGLPIYQIDIERRRWGWYSNREDFFSGMGSLLQHLHVDERKTIERDFMHLDKQIHNCLRSNNVYPERNMLMAAKLEAKFLADSTRLESIKSLLVFQIAGLAEPESLEQLQMFKVTFDRYLKKVMSAPKPEAAASAAEINRW
jgi:hypothetical protein